MADAFVNNADLGTMLICSVRYALKRTSYVTDEVANSVRRYWAFLSHGNQATILCDLREALEGARIRSDMVGHAVDHRIWQGLLDQLDEKEGGANAKGG